MSMPDFQTVMLPLLTVLRGDEREVCWFIGPVYPSLLSRRRGAMARVGALTVAGGGPYTCVAGDLAGGRGGVRSGAACMPLA